MARGQKFMCCVRNPRNINVFVRVPGREESGSRPGGSVTGVTEKLFNMCQMFMCLFRPLLQIHYSWLCLKVSAAGKRGLWEGVVQEPLRRALFCVSLCSEVIFSCKSHSNFFQKLPLQCRHFLENPLAKNPKTQLLKVFKVEYSQDQK